MNLPSLIFVGILILLFCWSITTTSPAFGQIPQSIYWTDIRDDSVYRANLDGTGIEVLFAASAGNAGLYDIDVDPRGKLFWAARSDGLGDTRDGIRTSNLDGSDADVIPVGNPGQFLALNGVVFDEKDEVLYVAIESGGIRKVKPDGSELTTIHAGARSHGLTVDNINDKLYWTDWGLNQILRSNLDGSGMEVLQNYPNPVDVEVDVDSGYVFWTNPNGGRIVRSDLSGGNVTVIETVASGFPQYLDIDSENELIYFTNNVAGTIERMDYFGNNHEVILSGLTHPIGISLGPAVGVPEPTTILLIDIKPGNESNPVNPKSKGVLSVAILGTADFDVNNVDIDTLLFGDPLLIDNGGTAVSPLRNAYKDVSHDGLLDLTLKFSTRDLVENEALGFDTVEGLLTGELLDGTLFEGMDSIRIVPPNGSKGNSLKISAVPEPTTSALALAAALCLAMSRRRSH